MKQAIAGVQAERIRQDVKYLSSDELEGRGTGAPGGELAAQYIAKGFAAAGLEPAGDNGTYFQRFGMVGIRTLPESSIAVTTPKRTIDLKYWTMSFSSTWITARRWTWRAMSSSWATASPPRSSAGTTMPAWT